MLNMSPWLYETTVLLESPWKEERKNEFVEVDLCVKAVQIKDPDREVRVLLKSTWNEWVQELPCQIWDVRRDGEWVLFRVGFLVNLPAISNVRVGILYGNDSATTNTHRRKFSITQDEKSVTIDNSGVIIKLDQVSRQPTSIQMKYYRTGFLIPIEMNPGLMSQTGVEVLYPSADGSKVISKKLSQTKALVKNELQGPLFYRQETEHRLTDSTGTQDNFLVESSFQITADQPWAICSQKVTALKKKSVTGLRLAVISAPEKVFTHFSFRPTTPVFPSTEVEEIGHVFIDKQHTAGMLNGSLTSDLLDLDLPWSGFISTRKNETISFVRTLLDWECSLPDSSLYRPATYVTRNEERISTFQAPIYCAKPELPSNVTVIPEGATFYTRFALLFVPFEESTWRSDVDLLGARLNRPITGKSHPAVFVKENFRHAPVQFQVGSRSHDYLKGGVR